MAKDKHHRFKIDVFTPETLPMERLAEYWTYPDLVESRLLFPCGGTERGLEGGRARVAEARMPSARVIEPFDVLANGLARLRARREGCAPDQI